MEFYESLILGIIQGITEWLPLSSEGITSLIMINFFNMAFDEAIYLALWLHTGTLLAAIIFFRKEIFDILLNIPHCFRNPNKHELICRLTIFLLISTILTASVGIPLILFGIDRLHLPGRIATLLIGILLILTGILQTIKLKKTPISKEIHINDSLLVGIIQGLSVLPGISRSGITVSTLLLLGYDAKKALGLSFLMSIPVVLVAEIGVTLSDKMMFDLNSMIAIMTSFFIGITTIKVLISTAERINFGYFCIFIGILSSIVFLI